MCVFISNYRTSQLVCPSRTAERRCVSVLHQHKSAQKCVAHSSRCLPPCTNNHVLTFDVANHLSEKTCRSICVANARVVDRYSIHKLDALQKLAEFLHKEFIQRAADSIICVCQLWYSTLAHCSVHSQHRCPQVREGSLSCAKLHTLSKHSGKKAATSDVVPAVHKLRKHVAF